MASVEPGDSFFLSLSQALQHPNAPALSDFLADEMLQIASMVGERWERLIPSRSDPYRRTLIATGYSVPVYAVQVRLRSDLVIELESITIDWDFPLDTHKSE